jgi:hypothetical protein
MRQVTGTDREAAEYVASVNNRPHAIALRYVIWEIGYSGRVIRKMSVKEARA